MKAVKKMCGRKIENVDKYLQLLQNIKWIKTTPMFSPVQNTKYKM